MFRTDLDWSLLHRHLTNIGLSDVLRALRAWRLPPQENVSAIRAIHRIAKPLLHCTYGTAMDWTAISDTALAGLTTVGLKILGAGALWIVGKWVIGAVLQVTERALKYQHLDATLLRYLQTSLSVLLKIGLFVAILGVLGVETATFAALIAAAGVAIGLAWSGLLANFAAGAFLVFLRPFKVGDA